MLSPQPPSWRPPGPPGTSAQSSRLHLLPFVPAGRGGPVGDSCPHYRCRIPTGPPLGPWGRRTTRGARPGAEAGGRWELGRATQSSIVRAQCPLGADPGVPGGMVSLKGTRAAGSSGHPLLGVLSPTGPASPAKGLGRAPLSVTLGQAIPGPSTEVLGFQIRQPPLSPRCQGANRGSPRQGPCGGSPALPGLPTR